MSCGEPDARERARPVRRAGRGNGPAVTPAPRPDSTRPLSEGDDARLVLVERETSGRQPLGEPGLDLERLLPGMAERDEIIGVPDQDRAAFPDHPGMFAGGVPGTSDLLHPVQSDVQQQRADYTALGNAVLGAVQPTLFDHAGLQPRSDHSLGGERAEHRLNVVVSDEVERPGQVCVQRPEACRALALDDLIDSLDRVMTATSGSKSIGLRLKPRLPLGLQRVDDPRLVAPVDDHRNP
jgi:hypothetical protein